jgi:hypothetical protein
MSRRRPRRAATFSHKRAPSPGGCRAAHAAARPDRRELRDASQALVTADITDTSRRGPFGVMLRASQGRPRMHLTRLFMVAAAFVLGVVGVACLFGPDLVLNSMAAGAAPGAMALVQVLGTLSLAFATLDWMWKGNRIGGIYGRPIVLANVLHFVSTALVTFKAISREPSLHNLWPVAVVYAAFGVGFFLLLFRDPTAPDASR